MKKITISLFILAILIVPTLSLPVFTMAGSIETGRICYDPLCSESLISQYTGYSYVDPVTIVSSVVNWGLGLLGIFSLCLILYAGFLWMYARGNEEEITKAKEILKGAVTGLILILASYSIANFVFSNLVNIVKMQY